MLQFKSTNDLNNLTDCHPAYPLVQDLINRLIINFLEDRPYYPHWVVSDKLLHRHLSGWCRVLTEVWNYPLVNKTFRFQHHAAQGWAPRGDRFGAQRPNPIN